MSHTSQTRKALSLFGLILLTGLFCAAQGAAVFTQGPTVAQQGDSAVSISFTVSESTDVEVGIADANGKIINHLAAGVLGGKYAPPEPLTAGLTQSLVWDFKDDDGGLAMGSGYKVRVRLNVRPKFVWKTGGAAWGTNLTGWDENWENRHFETLRIMKGGGSYCSIGDITQIPAKYNNGAYVSTISEMFWLGPPPDSAIMVLLKREADFFVGVRDAMENRAWLSRYSITEDSIIAGSSTYRIYKAHGQAGDRFFLPHGFTWEGPSCFCFVERDAVVAEGADPWNIDPQTDFLSKWHPLVIGKQLPNMGWLYNDHSGGDWFYTSQGIKGVKRYSAVTGAFMNDLANAQSGWGEGIFYRGLNDCGTQSSNPAFDVKNQFFYTFGEPADAPEGPGAVYRFNMADGKPSPWPQTGKYWVGGLNPNRGWAGGAKGLAVGPGGEVYVNSMGLVGPGGIPYYGARLYVKVVKDGAIIDTCRIFVHASFSTIQVDRKGNIYVGCIVNPKGLTMPEDVQSLLNPPPAYVNLGAISSTTGCILKFPNTGGSLRPTTTGDYDYEFAAEGKKLKATGLTWGYFGFSKVHDATGGSCWCYSENFNIDNWGRLFIPNTHQAQMVVIDNNRNVICKLKNRDIPETNIIPASMAVTDNYLVVNDPMNQTTTGFRLTASESSSVALPPPPLWVPLQQWALSFYADNGVTSPADPAIGIMAGSGAVSTLTVTPDSSWLKVTVSGNGAEQVIHHTADVTGLVDGRTYTTKVKITAAGFVTTWYNASMTVGVPKVQSIELTPKTASIGPNSTTQFSIDWIKDQYNQRMIPLPATVWSVSGGGSINNTGLFQSTGASGIFTVRVYAESNPGAMDSASIKVVLSTGCAVTASSSLEYNTWGKRGLTDGTLDKKFASDCSIKSGDEWVEIDLGGDKPFSRVILTPGPTLNAQGKSTDFPVDFTITAKTAAGVQTTLVTKTDYAAPDSGAPQVVLDSTSSVTARYIRLTVTKFGIQHDECRLQLAEMEILDMFNTGVETALPSPLYFGLQAVPNPFAASTLVKFNVPQSKNGEKQKVSVRVYDLNGKLVQTLAQGMFAAGYHTAAFNGREKGNGRTLSNGIYFCRMQAPGYSRTLKLLLVQ